MEKVVSFSGGRTSAKLVLMAISIYGSENINVVFMDTGAEHPKTYEFIRNLIDVFSVNVTCLRGDFSKPLGDGVGYKVVSIKDCKFDLKPFSEMINKYGVPYIGGMFCTDRMKLRPFKKYCDDVYGKNNYETILGIRADEPRRLRVKKNISYLADICDDEKQDVINWWSEQKFDLDIPEWLGNCVFCPKKSNLKLAAAQRDEPELYDEWIGILNSKLVRIDDKTGSREKMYRGKQSLEQLIAMFSTSTTREIKQRIRGQKMLETNSCSESCEAFICDAITIGEVKKVNSDENNFTYNGAKYVSVDGGGRCYGCAFYNTGIRCDTGGIPACTARKRKDGREVIFKKKADLDREAIEGILRVSAALAKEAHGQDLQDKSDLEGE